MGSCVDRYVLCPECSEKNQRKISAFDKANPEATVENWERFFDKNVPWQIKQMREHCKEQ